MFGLIKYLSLEVFLTVTGDFDIARTLLSGDLEVDLKDLSLELIMC